MADVVVVRIVTCQYDRNPHPIDDECVNVVDVVDVEIIEAAQP